MDRSSYLAAAASGLAVVASLRGTTEPMVSTIGGWASFGSAMGCVWAVRQEEPRWDKAIGIGGAAGAVFGSFILAVDLVQMK